MDTTHHEKVIKSVEEISEYEGKETHAQGLSDLFLGLVVVKEEGVASIEFPFLETQNFQDSERSTEIQNVQVEFKILAFENDSVSQGIAKTFLRRNDSPHRETTSRDDGHYIEKIDMKLRSL